LSFLKKARPVVAESVSRKIEAIEDAQLSATAQQIEILFLLGSRCG
jgi:hypothetical protein